MHTPVRSVITVEFTTTKIKVEVVKLVVIIEVKLKNDRICLEKSARGEVHLSCRSSRRWDSALVIIMMLAE